MTIDLICPGPPQPTMTKPIISQAFLSSSKTVTDPAGNPFIATKFSINCTIGYPRQEVDDGARFEVAFEADGVQFIKFATTSTDPFVVLEEFYLYGWLGKSVSQCLR